MGMTILSLSESCNVKGLHVKSILTSICHNLISELLVLNRTGCEVTLKNGTFWQMFKFMEFNLWDLKDESGSAQSLSIANVLSDSNSSNDSLHTLCSYVTIENYHEGIDTLLDLLSSYRQVFSLLGVQLGVTKINFHHIKLQSGSIYVPSYRLLHNQRIQEEEMVHDMLNMVNEESTSLWNSRLFLVSKKDGFLYPVMDFWCVNNLLIPDSYSLPVINYLLKSIESENKVFSSFELSGYWQIPLQEDSREITAFSTPSRH